MKRTKCLLMLLLCVLLSCNSQKNAAKSAETPISITDREWKAIVIENEKLEQLTTDKLPAMKLSEGKVTGFSSCNRMHGTYTMEKDKITFSQMAVTKMLCVDTQEIESKFLKALSEVKSWKEEKGKLHLLNENKQVIIIFE